MDIHKIDIYVCVRNMYTYESLHFSVCKTNFLHTRSQEPKDSTTFSSSPGQVSWWEHEEEWGVPQRQEVELHSPSSKVGELEVVGSPHPSFLGTEMLLEGEGDAWGETAGATADTHASAASCLGPP